MLVSVTPWAAARLARLGSFLTAVLISASPSAFLPCALVTIFFTWRLIVWLYPPEKEALDGGAMLLRDSLANMGLVVDYRGWQVHTSAPPSSGFQYLECLKMLEATDTPN